MADIEIPEVNSVWIHVKTKNYYQVISVANADKSNERTEEYPPSVHYRRIKDDSIWERRLSRWHGSFVKSSFPYSSRSSLSIAQEDLDKLCDFEQMSKFVAAEKSSDTETPDNFGLMQPCPFCGTGQYVRVISEKEFNGLAGGDPDVYTVVCDGMHGGCCSRVGYEHSKEAAVNKWNRRVA